MPHHYYLAELKQEVQRLSYAISGKVMPLPPDELFLNQLKRGGDLSAIAHRIVFTMFQ